MDDQRFLKACQLRDDGKLTEAIDEFCKIVEDTEDPVDKAGVLLNIAATFQKLGEYDKARQQLSSARTLVASADSSSIKGRQDDRLPQLEVSLDFEDADICSFEGKLGEALTKFDLLLKKCAQELKRVELRESYEMIQARRGFILGDLGRCNEALPILEEAEFFRDRKAEIAFYLGHCYLADRRDYSKAAGKLVEALRLGLPQRLEYRAHCELGIAYYRLKDYSRAKLEFEKAAETADEEYIQQAQIWKWLETTSRTLGLRDEADSYAKRAIDS